MPEDTIIPAVETPAEFVDKGVSMEATPEEWGDFLDSFIDESDRVTDPEVMAQLDEEEEIEEIPPKEEPPKVEPPKEEEPPKASEIVGDEGDLGIPAPPAVEAQTPSSPPELEKARESFRNQLIEKYALSKEDAEEMEISPSLAFPKIAAKLHIQILEQVMDSVHRTLPNAVQQTSTQVDVARKNEEEFYRAWPELKGHDKEIAKQATEFRQKFPQASLEEAVKRVGFNTLLALGVDPLKAANRLTRVGAPAKPVVPQKPVKPHVPVAPGRRGPVREKGGDKTIWQELIDD
jgi:hypothetical protein